VSWRRRLILGLAMAMALVLMSPLLAFARGVGGETVPLDIRQLFDEMLRLAKGTFPQSIIVRANVDGPLFALIGNSTGLHQVLLNL